MQGLKLFPSNASTHFILLYILRFCSCFTLLYNDIQRLSCCVFLGRKNRPIYLIYTDPTKRVSPLNLVVWSDKLLPAVTCRHIDWLRDDLSSGRQFNHSLIDISFSRNEAMIWARCVGQLSRFKYPMPSNHSSSLQLHLVM